MNTELEKAARQALEAMKKAHIIEGQRKIDEAITALRRALQSRSDAEPAMELRKQPAYRAVKTVHEGKPYYVSELEQQSSAPEPSHSDVELAAQIMSDCGCSTSNERLLERITERLAKHRPQPAERVKVWEAEDYEALMQEMQMVKARNIRQHAEIERLSALVRAQQITIDKLEHQPAERAADEPVACLVETEQGVMVWPIADYNEASTYCDIGEFPTPLYTCSSQSEARELSQPAAPQRSRDKKQWVHATEWRGLTDDRVSDLWVQSRTGLPRYMTFAGLLNKELREKNSGEKK